MRIDRTQRGFGIIRFEDALGRPCSLQKSSLADEDCIWLGRDDGGSRLQVRMHLTQTMASLLVHAFEAERWKHVGFEDRYGSACIARPCADADRVMIETGVELDFEGRKGETMLLDRPLATSLVTILRSFVHDGSPIHLS